MSPGRLGFRCFALTCVAAGLTSAVAVSPVFAGEPAALSVDPEAAARESWRTFMTQNPASEDGCFQAAYPSYLWEKVECKVAEHPRFHPVARKPQTSEVVGNGNLEVTGNGNDFVAKATGLISKANGTFPTVTGVRSETGVGVAAFGGGGILGPNEFSLQINSNFTGTTAACQGHSGCTVWQQYVYAPDFATQGEAAVFIESWLINFGSLNCPGAFFSDGAGDCVINSAFTAAPDEPITSLGKLTLSGSATAGGNDVVVFSNGTTAFSLSAKDSVVDIAQVWNEAEFNVVGNAGGSRANFNRGSSVTVKLALTDGSTAAPTCVANAGTTGETNNLNLHACSTAGGSTPSIQFTESN
jgi:hypothetical protein